MKLSHHGKAARTAFFVQIKKAFRGDACGIPGILPGGMSQVKRIYPEIDPVEALSIKRRIDKSNQDRTDLVERIDSYFLQQYAEVKPLPDAVINTESPAWAIDRLSILALKIYHMQQEVSRHDASPEHIERCRAKLRVLLEQRTDLSSAIDQLLSDIEQGRRYMKVYRQMKMYNDPSLNPVLYNQK